MDSSNGPRRTFFCHQCSQELDQVTQEYTCPNCQSGFIEELEEPLAENVEDEEESYGAENYVGGDQLMEQILGPMLFGAARGGAEGGGGLPMAMGGRINIAGARPGAGGVRLGVGGGPAGASGPLMLQELLANLTGQAFGGGDAGGGIFVPGGHGMQMYGNPGDYAWGRGGLDGIVTQLLNQLDGTGPAPLKTEYIKQIPSVKIAKEQIETKQQCSVCWEDFRLNESVRQLHCDHLFHDPCIVPWLELHSTCPVCRKSQDPEAGGPEGNEEVASEEHVAVDGEQEGSGGPVENAMSYVFNLLGYNGNEEQRPSNPASSASSTVTSTQSADNDRAARPSNSAGAAATESSSNQSQTGRDRGGEHHAFEDFDVE